MENKFKPFVINSNICTSIKDIATYKAFMNAIAGNTGNSYITWSLLKELGCSVNSIDGYDIKNIYTYDFSNSEEDVEKINNDCSHVILVLQDQIRIKESYNYRLPFSSLKLFISKIKKPILVAGLGANSLNGYDTKFYEQLDRELVDFLKFLSDHCEEIGVRGYFTQEVLHKLGVDNTCVIGCPSYYETGRNRVVVKPEWNDNIIIGTSSANYMLLTQSSSIFLQDMSSYDGPIIEGICYGAAHKMNSDIIRRIEDRKYKVYSSISSWKKELSKCDFFIGQRVHGGMVALNSGVPSVVMNKDSRAREMCEFMNIPYLPEMINKGDVKEIFMAADYNKMNEEYNYKLDCYISFLNRNGVNYNPVNTQSEGIDIPMYNHLNMQSYSAYERLRNLISGLYNSNDKKEKIKSLWKRIIFIAGNAKKPY